MLKLCAMEAENIYSDLLQYNFEPDYTEKGLNTLEISNSVSEDESFQARVEDFWSCTNCLIMSRIDEHNICCQGSDSTVGKLQDT